MNRQLITAIVFMLSVTGGCGEGGVQVCELPAVRNDTSLADQYADAAGRIISSALAGNDAYLKMQELCDDIGHRLSGSPELEQAIDWAVAAMKADGQDNAHREPVMVPRWVRGRESATMVAPARRPLAMMGLGMSVGTPPEGITAPVVCVRNEEEFEALGDSVKGKIVLFNNPMPPYDPEKGAGYGSTVRFRGKGPRIAAERGAVACLVRTVTAHSLRSPHTGATDYGDAKVKIPAAAISTEDAEMIARLLARGKQVEVLLKMEARHEGMVESANAIGELRGRERPEEVVVIGGHIDSWDVGQGAMDDGGGCVIAMEAINVLRKLDLIPRRTIRVVLFTNEENGLGGGKQYAEDHAAELANHVAAIESDSGIFAPKGFSLHCRDEYKQAVAVRQVRAIMDLLKPLGVNTIREGFSGADVGQMRDSDAVLMGFRVEGSKYFNYHHSRADTLDKIDPEDLSRCVATMAVMAYVLADMPQRIGEVRPRPAAQPTAARDGITSSSQ